METAFDLGDIVKFKSPTAGKPKYHLCVCVGVSGSFNEIHKFIFISSGGGEFVDSFEFDCSRFPMPPSKTGKSVVSLSMIPRIREDKMYLYNPDRVGKFPADVAQELLSLTKDVKSISPEELLQVREVFSLLCR